MCKKKKERDTFTGKAGIEIPLKLGTTINHRRDSKQAPEEKHFATA